MDHVGGERRQARVRPVNKYHLVGGQVVWPERRGEYYAVIIANDSMHQNRSFE